MEIKIGVQHAPRELIVESSESAEDIEKAIATAVAGEGAVLSLTDSKGRKIIIPAGKLAYVEIGGGVSGKLGFRS